MPKGGKGGGKSGGGGRSSGGGGGGGGGGGVWAGRFAAATVKRKEIMKTRSTMIRDSRAFAHTGKYEFTQGASVQGAHKAYGPHGHKYEDLGLSTFMYSPENQQARRSIDRPTALSHRGSARRAVCVYVCVCVCACVRVCVCVWQGTKAAALPRPNILRELAAEHSFSFASRRFASFRTSHKGSAPRSRTTARNAPPLLSSRFVVRSLS